MTTPTREQVVQWIQQTNVDLNTLALSEDDTHEILYVTTLASADLEATITEQAAELESLRKDAERLDYLDENLKFKMGWSVGAAPRGNLSLTSIILGGKPIREAIDSAIAEAAPKQEK